MEKIEVTIGYMVKMDNHIDYYSGETDNGHCYKDLDAWNNGGVIYISEMEIVEEPLPSELWTKDKWVSWVKKYFNDDELPIEFIEHIAYLCLEDAEWEDLSTHLMQKDNSFGWLEDNLNEWLKTNKSV